MADNKKYYYMRLKENFFDTDEMIYLEGLEEGYLFSNILLKLYLRSLKNDGVLMMNDAIPYDARMISKFTGHSLSTVEKALFEFKKLKLIEVLDSGQMYMSNIELFVGKASTEADRKREARKNIQKKIQLGTNVGQMSDERSPELELELELELENNNVPVKTDTIPYQEIIDYLNLKTGKKFRPKSAANTKVIKARFKEGYELEEFKVVIDKKVKEWTGTEYEKYLCPETLFGNKFEKYLNQNDVNVKNKNGVFDSIYGNEEIYDDGKTNYGHTGNGSNILPRSIPEERKGNTVIEATIFDVIEGWGLWICS